MELEELSLKQPGGPLDAMESQLAVDTRDKSGAMRCDRPNFPCSDAKDSPSHLKASRDALIVVVVGLSRAISQQQEPLPPASLSLSQQTV